MTVRANASDVKTITGSTLDDSTIETFINVANSVINNAITQGCPVSSATVLTQSEAFLAAHLITNTSVGNDSGGKVKVKETFENYSVEYAQSRLSDSAMGVMTTTYGQTANMLMNGWLTRAVQQPATIGFF